MIHDGGGKDASLPALQDGSGACAAGVCVAGVSPESSLFDY